MGNKELPGKYKLVVRLSDDEWKAFVETHQEEWAAAGEKITKLRQALKVSKATLAKDAGICTKTLTKLENGRFIRRFKAISKGCMNALAKMYYKANPEIKTLIEE